MPELCRFYGVRIKMYFDDHNPPDFYVGVREGNEIVWFWMGPHDEYERAIANA